MNMGEMYDIIYDIICEKLEADSRKSRSKH